MRKRMTFYDICLRIKHVTFLSLKVSLEIKNVPFFHISALCLFLGQRGILEGGITLIYFTFLYILNYLLSEKFSLI